MLQQRSMPLPRNGVSNTSYVPNMYSLNHFNHALEENLDLYERLTGIDARNAVLGPRGRMHNPQRQSGPAYIGRRHTASNQTTRTSDPSHRSSGNSRNGGGNTVPPTVNTPKGPTGVNTVPLGGNSHTKRQASWVDREFREPSLRGGRRTTAIPPPEEHNTRTSNQAVGSPSQVSKTQSSVSRQSGTEAERRNTAKVR